MKGEKIYNSAIYQSIIDLSSQENGMYLVHLEVGSEIIVKKIMLEK
jgi:hypothetical protein